MFLKNEHLIHLIQRKLSMLCESGRCPKEPTSVDLSFYQSEIQCTYINRESIYSQFSAAAILFVYIAKMYGFLDLQIISCVCEFPEFSLSLALSIVSLWSNGCFHIEQKKFKRTHTANQRWTSKLKIQLRDKLADKYDFACKFYPQCNGGWAAVRYVLQLLFHSFCHT